jgi:glycosyltransferase involved in cell wall biosynthesis
MYAFSVVIPVYYSQDTLIRLLESLKDELKSYNFQIVLVNDGSKDNSNNIIKSLVKENSNITYINLRKNFGEFNAVMCGLSYVEGKYAIIIDDDFQNPPKEILKLLTKAQEDDYDVVYSQYKEKKHSTFRNIGSSVLNFLISYLIGKPKDLYLSSFKLINKDIIDEIIKYKGPFPYIDGLIFQNTDHIGKIYVDHHEREAGNSNYTFSKLYSLFLNAILGYSILPIRVLNIIGLFAILMSFFQYFFNSISIFQNFPPYLLFKDGILLLALSLIGEYLGKSFLILSGKPQYVIKKVYKSEEKPKA